MNKFKHCQDSFLGNRSCIINLRRRATTKNIVHIFRSLLRQIHTIQITTRPYYPKLVRHIHIDLNLSTFRGNESDRIVNVQKNIVKKASNIAIRCSYNIYCRRKKQWSSPDLLNFKNFHIYFIISNLHFFSL